MTVKEFYEYCKEHELENYEIEVFGEYYWHPVEIHYMNIQEKEKTIQL